MVVNGNLTFHTLGSGELQNAIMERLTTAARTAVVHAAGHSGRMVYDTDEKEYYYSDGTQWVLFSNLAEINNIETAGGFYNADGSFNETPLNALTNVTGLTSGSDLVDALTQLDSAISTAAGVDTLGELTDVNTAVTSGAVTGDFLFFDGTSWDNTGFSAEPTDNFLLQWNATSNLWENVDPASIGGNGWSTINGDSGTSTADSTADTLTLTGAVNGGITTVASDDVENVTFGLTAIDLATGTATLALGDFIVVQDSADTATTVAQKYTFTDMVEDLDIVHGISANGILARTAADTYASRTISVSGAGVLAGLAITNGDGVAGNPTLGLDIDNLASAAADPVSTDVVAVFDGSANEKVTIAQLANAVGGSLTLDELSNVTDLTHTSGTGYILVGDGAGGHVVTEVTPSAPANFIEAIQDMISSFLVDGTDTTVTYVDGSDSIQVDVDDVFLRNTGDNLTAGTLTIDSGASINIATGGDLTITDAPVSGTDAVNKDYVDSVATGLDAKDSVRVATTAALPAVTYANGTLGEGATLTADAVGIVTIDGADLTAANGFNVGDRILVKNQANAFENGIYTITTLSAAGTALVLTRAIDNDVAAELNGGNHTFVEEGTTNFDSGWVVTTDGTVTVGTTAINWSQFTGAGSFTAGTGLGQSGSTIFIQTDELSAATIALTDTLPFRDVDVTITGTEGGDRKTTVQNFLDDLGIITSATGGNAITASDGVLINGQDVQLDIVSLSAIATTASDEMVFEDNSASGTHIKRSIADFITDHNILTGGNGGALTASDGIVISTNDLQLDIGALTAATVTGADLLVFNDGAVSGAGATHASTTVTNFMNDLDIVNGITADGMIVRTAADTYASRTITASAVAGDEGISVVNGDGVAGNPTVGLDINGLAADAGAVSTDVVALFDGTNNVKTTLAQIATAINSATNLGDLDDVNANSATDTAGNILVADGTDSYDTQTVQFIYSSTGTANTTHTVNHALGQQFVNVTVLDSSNNVIIPQSITYTDANNVSVVFNAAIHCKVVVMGITGVAVTSVAI